MSLRCLFGFHDWERHGGEYVAPAEVMEELRKRHGKSYLEYDTEKQHLRRPDPTGYISERFEQCSRCDKTHWGWTEKYEPRRPPTPVQKPIHVDRFDRFGRDCPACFLERHGGEVNPDKGGTRHACGKAGVARPAFAAARPGH